MTYSFRGLRNFIQEIRIAVSHEDELQRINEEKTKIRQCFSQHNVSSYDMRKYTLKMFYMAILGHKVDFGLVPVASLMASKNNQEKLIGYLTLEELLRDQPEFLKMVTQTILSDLELNKPVFNMSIALDFVANAADSAMAEIVAQPILSIIQDSGNTNIPTSVRKKATLALLKLYLINHEAVESSGVQDELMSLMEVRNVGFLNCLMHLMEIISQKNPDAIVPVKHRCIYLMQKIIIKREVSEDHIYYGMPSPWLLISLMRILTKLPADLGVGIHNGAQQDERELVTSVLERIFAETARVGVSGLQSKINIHWAVCVEAANLVAFYRDTITPVIDVRFMLDVVRSPATASNLKYAALSILERLTLLPAFKAQVTASIQDLAASVLNEPDYAVRHRGTLLLQNCLTEDNARAIVASLIYCAQCDAPLNYREDAVLRAINICRDMYLQRWVINAMLGLVGIAEECKELAVWKDFANIVDKRSKEMQDREETQDIVQTVLSMVEDEQGVVSDDKLLLTCFCYVFITSFLALEDIQKYTQVIEHAVVILQSPDTELQLQIAANAFLLLAASGIVPVEDLVPLCASECVEVQESVSEGYILMINEQAHTLINLICGDGSVAEGQVSKLETAAYEVASKPAGEQPAQTKTTDNSLDDLLGF